MNIGNLRIGLRMDLCKKVCVIILFFTFNCIAQQDDKSTFDEFIHGLDLLGKKDFKESLSPVELAAIKLSASEVYGIKNTGPAIMQAFILEEYDFVRLLWWEKTDRGTRMLVVALFWCACPPPQRNAHPWPCGIIDFESEAGRFASPEREDRIKEILFVKEHLADIAGKLAVSLADMKSEKAKDLHKRYSQQNLKQKDSGKDKL